MSEIQPLIAGKKMPEAKIQSGFPALFRKEVKRFYKVAFQTISPYRYPHTILYNKLVQILYE